MSQLDLDTIVEKVSQRLSQVEKARDSSYILHREVIKKSGLAIRAIHRGEREKAKDLIEKARVSMKKAVQAITGFKELPITGFMHDAQKEFAEASCTAAIVFNEDLPDPDDLGVSYAAFLNGISEVIGELRREILDLMRLDRGGEGEKYLQAMDEIYSVLVTMDFPDAVTGGLRRSTDQARGILERTRGDFTNYIVSRKTRKTMKSYIKELENEQPGV